jgi:hypothetical protein
MTTFENLQLLNLRHQDDIPEIFGPVFWDVLHRYANDNVYNKRWLTAFTDAIPCSDCRNHFRDFKHPTVSENFAMWAFEKHNKVNERLNKKNFTLEDYFAKYGIDLGIKY